MNQVAHSIKSDICHLETKCKDNTLSYQGMIALLLEWGRITHNLRQTSKNIEQKVFIDNATHLSKILTVLITQIGFSGDYQPLPEAILYTKHNQYFDLIEADSISALVYCCHKTIEGLAMLAAQQYSAEVKD